MHPQLDLSVLDGGAECFFSERAPRSLHARVIQPLAPAGDAGGVKDPIKATPLVKASRPCRVPAC